MKSIQAHSAASNITSLSAASGGAREHQVATSDGERLHVQDWGRGRPVVFVHGWTMNVDFWERQTHALVDHGLRCIAYDQRACGRSSPAAFGFDLDNLADDLDAVMRALDLRDAVLVAHSMGCSQVARHLTRHGAGRVAKVALTATVTPHPLADPAMAPAVFDSLEAAMLADRPRYVEELAAPFFDPAEVSPELIRWATGLVLQPSLRASIAYTRTNLMSDTGADLASFVMPTLVVHGGGDQTAPVETTAAPTAARIPAASLVVYEDAPHGLPLTHAERLNHDLIEFIAGRGVLAG